MTEQYTYGAPGCDETAVNLFSFQTAALLHQASKVFLMLPQTREEIEFKGEWTRTAHQKDFLLVDTGQNDQNHLAPFTTVGNLEKLCEAETIYIDGTFQGQPTVVLIYQLFTVHVVYNGQHFPFVYGLLPNKTTTNYNRLFTKLND